MLRKDILKAIKNNDLEQVKEYAKELQLTNNTKLLEELALFAYSRANIDLIAYVTEEIQPLEQHLSFRLLSCIKERTDSDRQQISHYILSKCNFFDLTDNQKHILNVWTGNEAESTLDNLVGNEAVVSLLAGGYTQPATLLLGRFPSYLNEQVSPQKSFSSTTLWWLASTLEGRALLAQQPALLIRGNLDAAPTNGPHQGFTVLWCLASTPEGRTLLVQQPALLTRGNLDAAPTSGPSQGKTVLWWLAGTSEGRALLAQQPALLTRGNLGAAPTHGPDQTVLWWLATTLEGRALLAQQPALLIRGNLDVAPTSGPYQGITVLLGLAGTPEGRALLAQQPALLTRGNLDATSTSGPYQGKTVLWWLAGTPEGRALLAQQPALLTRGNLDAAPTSGPYQGITVLWLLFNEPEAKDILQPSFFQQLLNVCRLEQLINGKTQWEHILTSANLTPTLLKDWLYQRGIPNTVKFIPSKEVRTCFNHYQQALQYINNFQFEELYQLLRQEPWLIEARLDADANTMLHGVLKKLDSLSSDQLAVALDQYKRLFDLLSAFKKHLNNNDFTPVECIQNSRLKTLFLLPQSPIDAVLDELITDSNLQLAATILAGKCKLANPLTIIKAYEYEYKYEDEKIINLLMQRKSTQVMDTNKIIHQLEDTFNQLIGYFELYNDEFSQSSILKIKQWKEKIDATKEETHITEPHLTLLGDNEEKQLENFINNLIILLSNYHTKKLGSRKESEKQTFGKVNADLDLNKLITDSNMDLATAIMTGRYDLSYPLNTEETIRRLENAIDQLINHAESLNNQLNPTNILKIKLWQQEINAIRKKRNIAVTEFNFSLLPDRRLNKEEERQLEHFIKHLTTFLLSFHPNDLDLRSVATPSSSEMQLETTNRKRSRNDETDEHTAKKPRVSETSYTPTLFPPAATQSTVNNENESPEETTKMDIA